MRISTLSSATERTGSVSLPRPGDRAQRAREAEVSRRARDFEVSALLDVLGELGYRDRDVILRSHYGLLRPSSLVKSVTFEREPRRCAVVTINLGLLGSESPLPSYIHKLLEDSLDRLVPFFEYFDHALLRGRLRALWPERDRELGNDWDKTRRSMSKLVRMDSPAMADWLARRVFPELEVAVRRTTSKRTIPIAQTVIGKSSLGAGAALGGVTEVLCGGLAITLVTVDPLASGGRPWQEEAARRVREQLLPQVIDSEMALTVTLVIRDRPSRLQLSASSFLGLQPLQSGSASTKVLIFDGPIQNMGARSRLLGQDTRAPAADAPAQPLPSQLIDAARVRRRGHLPDAPDEADEAAVEADVEQYLARIP